MKEKPNPTPAGDDLPEAKITRKRWFNVIWLVPIVAGMIAGWLVYKDLRQAGPNIVIHFDDGTGLQAGNTLVLYRGVTIGEVRSVELTSNSQSVAVKVRLKRSAARFASEDSTFWVVRADAAIGSLRGLDTIVGGPYIQAQLGNGPKKKDFVGLEQGPVIAVKDGGLDITLSWSELGWLNAGAPLYYRGVEVGVVQDYSLGERATNIIIHAHVLPQFAPLVRADSKFWNAGGIKADLSLLGVKISAESLKSLLVGGIAFATPSPPGPPPPQAMIFPLNQKAEDKWLKWSPPIVLNLQTNHSAPTASTDVKSLPAAAGATVSKNLPD